MENINKPSKEDIIEYNFLDLSEKRQKEILIDLYIKQNLSQIKVSLQLGISKKKLHNLLLYYGIQKSLDAIKQSQSQQRSLNIDKEDIYYYYIEKNFSLEETARKLNVSFGYIVKKVKQFNICKTKEKKQELIKKTLKTKYGVSSYLKTEEINRLRKDPIIIEKRKEGIQKTCFEKYGVSSPLGNKEIFNKTQDTMLQRYGVKNPFELKEIQDKIKENNLNKYGVAVPHQKDIQHYEIWNSCESFRDYIINLNVKKTIYEIATFFNVDYSTAWKKITELDLINYIDLSPSRSHFEDEIIKILKEDFNIQNIEVNNRNILLSGREIDIYLPDYKIGIEFNGDYWHCELQEKFQDHGGRSLYHQNKSLEAENQGIFLFHIFEHEWDEIWTIKNPKFQNSHENIINRLSNILIQVKNHIPARKCEIREITKEQKKEFLNKNHIQGNEYIGSYALGLFYENQLVSCMCFGRPKYAKYNYELTRFATIHDTIVQGGASKLFKYFIKNKMKEGEKIVSYNDITKTKGDIYKTLGFECVSINNPNYWWINFYTHDVRSRYLEQKAGENDRMHNQGYYRICDCGTRTWVYTKK